MLTEVFWREKMNRHKAKLWVLFVYGFRAVQMCWSFNNNDDIEVIADPKGFRFGNLEYLLVEIPSNADNAATWCRENVNGTLPVPDTEWEFNLLLDGMDAVWAEMPVLTEYWIGGEYDYSGYTGFTHTPGPMAPILTKYNSPQFSYATKPRWEWWRPFVCKKGFDKPEAEYFINENPLTGYKLGDGYPGTCERLMSVRQCSSLATVSVRYEWEAVVLNVTLTNQYVSCREPNVLVFWKSKSGKKSLCSFEVGEVTVKMNTHTCNYTCHLNNVNATEIHVDIRGLSKFSKPSMKVCELVVKEQV